MASPTLTRPDPRRAVRALGRALAGHLTIDAPVVLAALVLAALASVGAGRLTRSDVSYPDLIAGSLGRTGAGKAFEVGFGWSAALTAPLAVLLVAGLGAVAAWRFGAAGRQRFAAGLLLALVPAAFWLGGAVLGQGYGATLPVLSAAALAGWLALTASTAVRPGPEAGQVFDRDAPRLGVAALLSAFACGLLPVAVARWTGDAGLDAALPARAMGIGAPVALALALAAVHARADRRERLVRLWLVAAQAPLALGFAVAVPALWATGGGVVPGVPAGGAKLFLGALAVAAWLDLAYRARAAARPGAAPWAALSPLCLAGLVVAAKLGPPVPAVLPPDDFHFGESLLPWFQWMRFGLVPYIDLDPAQGWFNVLPGLVNGLLFDGSAGSMMMARLMVRVAVTTLAAVALAWRVGPLAAAGLLVVLPLFGRYEIYMLAVAGLALFSDPRLLRRPVGWLAGAGAASVALTLYGPAQGAAFIVALTPVALVQLVLALRRTPRRLAWLLGGLAVAAGLALGPGAVLVGALRYLLENEAVNQAAYGLPLHLPGHGVGQGAGQGADGEWPADLLRMGWVAALSLLSALLIRAAAARAWAEAAVAGPCLLLTLLMLPFALGRIDPGVLGKPGMLATLALVALVPLAALCAGDRRRMLPGVLAWALAAGLLQTDVRPLPDPTLAQAATVAVPVPAGAPVVEGLAVGLPTLGRTAILPDHLDRLRRTRALLDRLLPAGAPYLDLTNHNAHYVYFERPVPGVGSAYYTQPAPAAQARSLARMGGAVPDVVLLAPAIPHDGLGPGLRTPLLAGAVLEAVADGRLVARESDGLAYLVAPARLPPETPAATPDGNANTNADAEAVLGRAGFRGDVGALPAAWGRAWKRLSGALAPVRALGDGAVVAEGSRFDLEGFDTGRFETGRAGVLVLDLACPAGTPPRFAMAVRWTGAAGRRHALPFTGAPGRLVVPLDAEPGWRLARSVTALDVTAAGPCAGAPATAALWRRRAVPAE